MRGDDAYAILRKKMEDMQGEKIQESVYKYLNENPVQPGATDISLDSDSKKLILINSTGNVGDGLDIEKLSAAVEGELTETDPDGTQDGVVHLDQLVGNDKLLK